MNLQNQDLGQIRRYFLPEAKGLSVFKMLLGLDDESEKQKEETPFSE